MNYETIFQTAREIAQQRIRNGEPVLPDDTVCVIASVSGKLYTALNRRENVNGTIRNIHAEKEVIRSMQAAAETGIQTVLLLACSTGLPLLPCDDCMRSIIALNPDNIRCEIMMMDRAVPIAEFLEHFRKHGNMQNMQTSQPYAHAAPAATAVTSVTSVSVSAVSVQIPEATNDADIIRSKVSSLLHAAEDDEDDTDKKPKPEKKKRFGGFFGKK